MASVEKNTPRKRPWFRFSLRTLLLVMTVVALWFGFTFSRARHEERAAKAILAADGKIVYDWQVRSPDEEPKTKLAPAGPLWLRKLFGLHWFDSIVQVEFRERRWRDPQANIEKRFAKFGPKLLKLSKLKSMRLYEATLSKQDCQLIAELSQLEELSCGRMKISDEEARMLSMAPNLQQLRLDGVHITTQGLEALAKLPRLKELRFTSPYNYDSEGEDTQEYWLQDEGLQAFADCKQLSSLQFHQTLITDEGIRSLGKLKQLEKLMVHSPNITGKSLEFVVARMKNLEYLSTTQWKIDDDDLLLLQELPKLRVLSLYSRDRITDAGLPHLAKLKGLTWLALYGDNISEAGLRHLHGMTHLKGLNLTSTTVGKHSAAAKELQQALPRCNVRLPKTEKEKQMQDTFHAQKFGGFLNAVQAKNISPDLGILWRNAEDAKSTVESK